jgi:hypothetical protein
MANPSHASSVQPLLPYEVYPGRLLLAGGARAGDWIFASGLMPTRFGSAARPLSGEPGWTIQFRSLWERAQAVLEAGGTDLAHLHLLYLSSQLTRRYALTGAMMVESGGLVAQ